MLYKIENKFYVKVGGYFVEVVKAVGPDNNIILKPTDNKIEYNQSIKYEVAKKEDMAEPQKTNLEPRKKREERPVRHSRYNISDRYN